MALSDFADKLGRVQDAWQEFDQLAKAVNDGAVPSEYIADRLVGDGSLLPEHQESLEGIARGEVGSPVPVNPPAGDVPAASSWVVPVVAVVAIAGGAWLVWGRS